MATQSTARQLTIPLQARDAPLLSAPLTADRAADLARLLRALADPTRLRLVSMIAACDGGEACVLDLTEPLGLSQPTISHHLKILVDSGILSRDKRGVWAYYALVPSALDDIAATLMQSEASQCSGSAGEPAAMQSGGAAGRRRRLPRFRSLWFAVARRRARARQRSRRRTPAAPG